MKLHAKYQSQFFDKRHYCCRKDASCWLFCVFPNDRNMYNKVLVDTSKPFCVSCAVKKVKEDTEDEDTKKIGKHSVGFLFRSEFVDYLHCLDLLTDNNGVGKIFRKEGLAVINMDDHHYYTVLLDQLKNTISGLNVTFELLAHNFETTSNHNKGKNHSHRSWYQVYPMGAEDDLNKKNTLLMNHGFAISNVKTFVQKVIFPQEHFSCVAVNNFVNHNVGMKSLTEEDIKEEVKVGKTKNFYGPSNSVLRLQKINALAKGKTLTVPQQAHVDDLDTQIVFLMVLECFDSYNFQYIPKSHNIQSHDFNFAIPNAAIENVEIKKNQLLVFAGRLIHRGGVTSHRNSNVKYLKNTIAKENQEKKEKDSTLERSKTVWFSQFKDDEDTSMKIPTDLSLQFSCLYEPVNSGSDVGRSEPSWYKNTTENSTKESDEYLKCNSPPYLTEKFNDNEKFTKFVSGLRVSKRKQC